MRVNHIGYAVQNIEDAAQKFVTLGYIPVGEIVKDVERQVYIQFFEDINNVRIELIAPLQISSPVTAWIEKNGSSPYHICYECSDLDAAMMLLEENGFLTVQAPASALAFDGSRVAFLYSTQTGLLELLEVESTK